MKRISEKMKESRAYGQGEGDEYIPFVQVGEFGSNGTCANPIDWITGRVVHLFSQGEVIAWYTLRWRDDVSEVREQYPLDPLSVKKIAKELGIRPPNNGRTTPTSDFLVTFKDHSQIVVSVKAGRDCLENVRTVEKLYLEKEYWRRKGVSFDLLFKEELNHTYASNIRRVVAFYNSNDIVDDISVLKHLIAHKQVVVDMETNPLNFKTLVQEHWKEVAAWKKIHMA